MKSHALLRTNVALTTNVKIVVGASGSIYFDSINSVPALNDINLKKREISKLTTWEFALCDYWRNTLKDNAFAVRNDSENDRKNMGKDFFKQYDDIYFSGARNISNNKDFDEEFEYFAPLHIEKKAMPKFFGIFRIDGPGNINLTKNNFRSEILQNMKVVKVFDLFSETSLGNFISKSILLNGFFPRNSLNISYYEKKFSITGIKYPTQPGDANFVTMTSNLRKQTDLEGTSFSDMQSYITDSYRSLGVIYPHIINFSFLFDDMPATPTTLRKWSLNRYMGFYFDNFVLEKEVTVSVFPKLKDDVVIGFNNILESISGGGIFVDDVALNDLNKFIEVDGKIYLIRECPECNTFSSKPQQTSSNISSNQVSRDKTIRYKIISDTDLFGKRITPKVLNEKIKIVFENNENRIKLNDDTPFTLDNFEQYDMWIMKINGEFFKLRKNQQGFICIHTDYAFEQNESKIDYYINDPDPSTRKSFRILLEQTLRPVIFSIYRCQFTDIKDFDTDIVETEYAKFEYDKEDEIISTEEPKLYVVRPDNRTFDVYKVGNQNVYLPASSEYTSTFETFQVKGNLSNLVLTNLWNKNPKFVKWGFSRSLDSNDYPYYMTLAIQSQVFNRTTNFLEYTPRRVEKNLDYFYTVNSATSSYSHHSLHVEDHTIPNFNFELDKYLGQNYDLDYFTYFFGKKSFFSNGKIVKNTHKWSEFLPKNEFGLNNVSNFFRPGLFTNINTVKINKTVFRGLQFEIGSFNPINEDEYDGYKFAAIMTENNYDVYPATVINTAGTSYSVSTVPNAGYVQKIQNVMVWDQIDYYKNASPGANLNLIGSYNAGDLVILDETLFIANTSVTASTSFSQTPWFRSEWSFFTQSTIFWRPDLSNKRFPDNSLKQGSNVIINDNNMTEFGNFPSLVYKYGKYFFYKWPAGAGAITGLWDFWIPNYYQPREKGGTLPRNPFYIGYSTDEIVYHKGDFYRSTIDRNRFEPTTTTVFWRRVVGAAQRVEAEARLKWREVIKWDSIIYTFAVNLGFTPSGVLVYAGPAFVGEGTPSNYPTVTTQVGFWFQKGQYVFYNESVYLSSVAIGYAGSQRTVIKNPGEDSRWIKVHSFVLDTNTSYGPNMRDNNIISQGGTYFICRKSELPSSPDPNIKYIDRANNGVTVYINKKYKNILLNIYVNDRLFSKAIKDGTTWLFDNSMLNNTDRDKIYDGKFNKFVAVNMRQLFNNPNILNGFSQYLKYVVIDESGKLFVYDHAIPSSIDKKPISFRISDANTSIKVLRNYFNEPVPLNANLIKPKRQLVASNLEDTSKINYYSNLTLSSIPFYSSQIYSNIFTFYRHSGPYSPIFRNIELFKVSTYTQSHDNFLFDTELTNFGISGEIVVSKVNRFKSVLKLANNTNLFSVFPMLDEFAYHVVRKFIFKSTWDFEYLYECVDTDLIDPLQTLTNINVGQPDTN